MLRSPHRDPVSPHLSSTDRYRRGRSSALCATIGCRPPSVPLLSVGCSSRSRVSRRSGSYWFSTDRPTSGRSSSTTPVPGSARAADTAIQWRSSSVTRVLAVTGDDTRTRDDRRGRRCPLACRDCRGARRGYGGRQCPLDCLDTVPRVATCTCTHTRRETAAHDSLRGRSVRREELTGSTYAVRASAAKAARRPGVASRPQRRRSTERSHRPRAFRIAAVNGDTRWSRSVRSFDLLSQDPRRNDGPDTVQSPRDQHP